MSLAEKFLGEATLKQVVRNINRNRVKGLQLFLNRAEEIPFHPVIRRCLEMQDRSSGTGTITGISWQSGFSKKYIHESGSD